MGPKPSDPCCYKHAVLTVRPRGQRNLDFSRGGLGRFHRGGGLASFT